MLRYTYIRFFCVLIGVMLLIEPYISTSYTMHFSIGVL